jgi:hypothetical protein
VNPRLSFIAFCLAAVPLAALGDNESPLHDAGIAKGMQLAGVEDPQERKVFIVQMREPSAVEFRSTLQRTTASLPVQKQPRVRFDKNAAAIQSYAEQLRAQQE